MGHIRKHHVLTLAAALLAVALAEIPAICAQGEMSLATGRTRRNTSAEPFPQMVVDGTATMAIRSGDKIAIKVFKEDELTGIFDVDQAGSITYPLLGDIHVEGLTLQELKEFLVQELGKDYIVNPQIQVGVVQSASQSVSVLGEVADPGNYVYAPGSSLLRLISQVGGFTQFASLSNVRIVRLDRDKKKVVINVDVTRLVSGEDDDFPLEPGDVIYVEKDESKDPRKQDLMADPSKLITVLGEVGTPGNFPWTEGLTLIRLIGQAGDFTPTAAKHNVRIVRKDENGVERTFHVNCGKILAGRSPDVPVQAGDLVVVQESFF